MCYNERRLGRILPPRHNDSAESKGSMNAIIRPARLGDVEALHRHCYPEQDLETVRDYLAWCLRQAATGRIVRLVADVGGQAVGNAQLTVWGQVGEIGSLVVAEAFRQRGLARRLAETLIAEARRQGLAELEISVLERQPAVLAFYERLGFRQVGPASDRQKKGLTHAACPEPVVHLRMLL